MKQNITPSFHREVFPGLDFRAPDVDGKPTESFFGYSFGTTQVIPVYSGWFAPHSILSPSKDTVDIKAYVHWTCSNPADMFSALPVPNPHVGWLVSMEILRENMLPNCKVNTLPLLGVEGSYFDPHMFIFAARIISLMNSPVGTLRTPTVQSYDADGHIDWKYDVLGEFFKFECKHPYSQMAIGYQAMNSWKIPGEGYLPVLTPYKTQVAQIKKKASGLYLDSSVSFNDFSKTIDGYDAGIAFCVYRMQAQTGATAGQIPDGTFDTDNYNKAVAFLGLEFEIV